MAEATLNVKVTQTGAGVVQRDLAAIGKEATTAGYAVRSLNHLLGVVGVAMVIEKLVSWGDEWQNIHNKLLNVTSGVQNLTAVNEALFQGAQKSRTAYGEFVNVFQEMAIQAHRFGISQQQTVDVTTTMMQAAQLAHPSIAAMKAGVEQLVLSMERGRLQTRGFSALLKDTPQLAKAMADGLGISINALRELAHHAKLTSVEMIQALEKVGPKVAEEFLKLTPTFAGAMTVLHNGWIKFIGDLDSSTGILSGLTSLIIGLSNHVDVLAYAFTLLGIVASVSLGGVARKAIVAMWAAFEAGGPVAWALGAIAAIGAALAIFGDKVAVSSDGFVSLLDVVKGVFQTIGDYIKPIADYIVLAFSEAWQGATTGAFDMPNVVLAAMELVLGVIKGTVNLIIGIFRYLYDVSVLIWDELKNHQIDTQHTAFTILNAESTGWLGVTLNVLKIAGKAWEQYSNGVAHAKAAAGEQDPNAIGGTGFFSKLDAIGARDIGANGHLHDYVGNAWNKFVGDVAAHARANAAARHAAGGGAVDTITNPPELDSNPTKKKHAHTNHAKTRGELIDEEVKKYADQTVDANNLSLTPWTDAAYREVTRFNDQLMKTKDAKGHFMAGLDPTEKASMIALVQTYEDANRVQKERFTLLNEFQGPQVKYQDTLKAISQLESTHAITAGQAARAERDAQIALLDTKFDAASGAMKGQLEILKQMDDRARPLADSMRSIWQAQEGPLRAYQTELQAVNALLHDQLITAKEAATASRDAAISYLDTQTDAAAGVTRALLKIQKTAQDVATQMEQTINDAFTGMQDAWVALMTGGKFDAKSAIKTIQTDLAKSSFQQMISPVAGFLQQRFGISLPGLAGKVGESRANPMWVKNADASFLPGADVLGGGRGPLGDSSNITSIMSFLGIGSSKPQGPLGGDTQPWDESFRNFNTNLDGTLRQNANLFGSLLGGAVMGLGQLLGGVFGHGKTGTFFGTLLNIGTTVLGAYLSSGKAFSGGGGGGGGDISQSLSDVYSGSGVPGFATGGAMTVGGGGGVDSQLVQFKASPGERVSIDRGGDLPGATMNFYDFNIDARGATDETIEQRMGMVLARVLPEAEKRTRAAAVRDVAELQRRQRLAGSR